MIRRLALLVLLIASPARAHDYWLAPSEHVVPADREVTVSLLVGERLVAEDAGLPMELARTPRLDELHAGRTVDLLGTARDGARPMLRLPLRGAGGHLLVMDRVPASVELEPAKFEAYLKEEGLETIIGERARRGETTRPGRERYRRNLKALFQVGATRDDTATRTTGQTLELIPEQDPSFAAPGDTLVFRVMFRDQPLAGVRVDALSRATTDGVRMVHAAPYTTDATGRVRIAIDRRGSWLVRTVHMIRCEASCEDHEWDSFWGAYTFGNTASAAPAASPSRLPWIAAAIGVLLVLFALRRR